MIDIEADWQPIAPQARFVWMVGATAIVAPAAILAAVALIAGLGPWGSAAGLAVVAGALALTWWLVDRRFRAWGYALRDDELLLRRGRVLRRLTIVPIGRMQLIDLQQGPLDRRLGVTNLQLRTAAAGTDAKVPLLSLADAASLRDELLRRGAGRSSGT